jgi:heme exporter protein D
MADLAFWAAVAGVAVVLVAIVVSAWRVREQINANVIRRTARL